MKNNWRNSSQFCPNFSSIEFLLNWGSNLMEWTFCVKSMAEPLMKKTTMVEFTFKDPFCHSRNEPNSRIFIKLAIMCHSTSLIQVPISQRKLPFQEDTFLRERELPWIQWRKFQTSAQRFPLTVHQVLQLLSCPSLSFYFT